MMFRQILCSWALLAAVIALRADTSQNVGDWDSVTVDAVETSIYVGTVKLTMTEFRRAGDRFSSTYEAKVWPWFFWNESGEISITLTREDLEKIARGERTEFTGEALNHKRKPRHITGYAERANAATGKIKVRIGVDDTELIFNSTYRFNNVLK